MSFDDLLIHALIVKRLAPATAGSVETVGGADTTLTADTTVGATILHVASAAGIADGDYLRIGDSGETEVRTVAPGGVAGLVVTVTAGLNDPHDAGDQVRELDDAGTPTVDDYGQPVMTETTVATVAGLIQPRRAREIALASQAGAAVADFIGYMDPLAGLSTRDWVERDGIRYDILSIGDASGMGHHLELGLREVS